ncbi:MAG: hypothetical protein N3F67_03125 [Acidilobaceae archaeon]|nr:hypothetical protein [Acidilobaceae archaeon]
MTCADARKVVGIDLAASEQRCTGFSYIDIFSRQLEGAICLRSDEEILSTLRAVGARVVAIDAPLAEIPAMREVDKLMISIGFRVLPPTFGAMRKLTQRAWRLSRMIECAEVIETHPRSALLSSGARDVAALLARLGVRSAVKLEALNRDQLDAVVSAAAALCYAERWCSRKVEARDGRIFLISL